MVETNADFAVRAALLVEARRVPEVARREVALRVIRRLKALRAASPPPPRALPLPLPKNGSIFPELMNDPEYRALAWRSTRSWMERSEARRLKSLGVSPEVQRQIVDLRLDAYFANMDAEELTQREGGTNTETALTRARIDQETEQKIRGLLSDEVWPRYEAGLFTVTEGAFKPLATRLSYTSTPLTSQDEGRLQELLKSDATPPATIFSNAFPSLEFIDRARAFLQPGQVEGLIQLHDEREAWTLRAKLPKSSELPRNTRRAKKAATQ